MHDQHPAHRHLRLLGADLVFRMPVLSELARKAGHTLACNPDAERLLARGELVGVFPEGFKGIGKPFARPVQAAALRPGRLRLGRAARPDADRPVRDRRRRGDLPDDRQHQAAGPAARPAVLPGHADVPAGSGRSGLVPLPSKWLIEFGEPIPTDALTPTRPTTRWSCSTSTDQVRETIQKTLHDLLRRRASIFF